MNLEINRCNEETGNIVRPNFSQKLSSLAKYAVIGMLGVAFGLGVWMTMALAAEGGADKVFSRYKDQVVQVRIVEASSGAKSTVGSCYVCITTYVNSNVPAEVVTDATQVGGIHEGGACAVELRDEGVCYPPEIATAFGL